MLKFWDGRGFDQVVKQPESEFAAKKMVQKKMNEDNDVARCPRLYRNSRIVEPPKRAAKERVLKAKDSAFQGREKELACEPDLGNCLEN